MKRLIIILCVLPFAGFAQGLLGRLKQAATEVVVSKSQQLAEKKIDKVTSPVENHPNNNREATKIAMPATSEITTGIRYYSHYDFVPGQAIIYADNFDGANIGELPAGWNTNGNGVVVNAGGINGNWLKMDQNATFLSAEKLATGKDFTLEFDLITQFANGSYLLPEYRFGLIASGKKPVNDNSFLSNPRGDKTLECTVNPRFDEHSSVGFKGFKNNAEYFAGNKIAYAGLENNYGKVMHVAISIQHERARIWINGEKLFDAPNAVADNGNFNQFYFHTGSSNYKNDAVGFYLSNIKMANGLPDTRSQLMNEGKYVTTGILFDKDRAEIKPASFGVINEIGQLLVDNPELKLKITGHTDADGNADHNKQLSLDRANAVKTAIMAKYGILPDRLETDGKGSAQPASDNKTNTGKAQNRRVEFIKQ